MNLVKTFDSTGIAPNGRIYAGDLNAIQAAAAAQADFAQTIDLGTLRVGEAGLTLSRIGAGEAQLAGDLRVTKIIRGLEGIIPGAFTTSQRDAIASGRAPYGLAILNTEKNKWEWNTGTDGARNWQPFGIDSLSGTLGTRPAASSVTPGSFYYATDQDVLYRSNGSAWSRVATPPAGATMAWFNASVPTGWVAYDGTNLPSATGIYADLATHLGGVATPNTKGRVIVGRDTGDADFDTILETRGAKTHTLGITEIPPHAHAINWQGAYALVGVGTATGYAGGDGDGVPTTSPFIENAGGGGAHNNIQPSIVGVYIAKL
jgi:microcystin-dependent protein